VTLVQEIYEQKQPGFLLFVAVFEYRRYPQSVAEREAALRGFVYCPFRAGDFFDSIFRAERGARLHFKIYDGTDVGSSTLLYESTNEASAHPWISTNRVVNIPGHHWTIALETTPAFEHVLGSKTAVVVPTAGIAASLVLFGFTFYFVRQHEEVLQRGAERDRAQQQIERLNRDLEKRVDERTAELRETNSQLESFIYTVAHDLRTPLRSIRGFAEILQEDCGPKIDDRARSHLDRIIRSAGEMDNLIKDLLEYSRVSRDRIEVQPVQLNGLFSELETQLEPEIHDKHATLSIQSPLPAVMAHELTLRQVFANLLANALKFVNPAQHPEVRVYSEPAIDGHVRIWVEDKGVGIDPKHFDRIFGVFEQLDPETYGGTGIGLAIVRRAVERMGGHVGVESQPEKGSRFYVELRKA
jgi:signal transduction histidine kinase